VHLNELIAVRKTSIVALFVAGVHELGTELAGATRSEIIDHLPEFLDEMARTLESALGGDRRSHGEKKTGTEHGEQRRSLEVDLVAVVREYELLRGIILRLASESDVDVSIAEYEAMSRSFAIAITAAVDQYAEHRDSQVKEERASTEVERYRLRTVLDLLPVGAMICDAEGRATETNQAMHDVWASHRQPLLQGGGDGRFAGWDPKSGARAGWDDSHLARSLRTGATFTNVEMEIEAFDGARKTILVSSAPIHHNGAIAGAVVINVDITPQANALKESRLAVRTREDVLAVVAHDLKNPLNAIQIAASRLQRGADQPSAQKLGATVHRAVGRMNRLITDLLELAQLEAGHLSLTKGAIDVRVVVREALESVQAAAQSKGVWLEKERTLEDVVVVCDRDRLLQVLCNLLGNAVKFTPEGGSIFVRLAREPERVVFEVADTGQGIPEERRGDVFDRFWQAPDAARVGHGLGLSIARGIVEAHGGAMWLASTIGVGSSFFFSLPISETDSSRWAVSGP
jgi:signal transduction histidine kinase